MPKKTLTADFLVEIGSEELPPKALKNLERAFGTGVERGLADARLDFAALTTFATPRRLAIVVTGLQLQQESRTVERKGPPVRLAFDEAGNPTRAASAFAGNCGVSPDQLERVETPKGEWLVWRGDEPGLSAAELLPGIIGDALLNLPIPKKMRWSDGEVEFVRPVHWAVMLLGNEVIDATILGLDTGRETRGHRFLAPESIPVGKPGDYAALLEKDGRVIASFDRRREQIREAAVNAAAETGGVAVMEDGVLDEVTALVEWPVAVPGRFDPEFLDLPPEVLIATLQEHQRYFPVRDSKENLAPAFIAISNIESSDPEQVREGNERVVRPRLADATFFWRQDIATSLDDRVAALGEVVYQKGLGSVLDRSQRIAELAAVIACKTGADSSATARAARLAKTDLLTSMVAEFPELQGRMGYYYAVNDGEPDDVSRALEEQYLPRHAGGRLPETAVGTVLSLADRLDALAGIFALGNRPTGNRDPYGLRRAAVGLLRIMIESNLDLDLVELLRTAIKAQPLEDIDVASETSALYDFIIERLRGYYLDGLAPDTPAGSVSVEMFESVRTRSPASPLDFHERLQAVRRFVDLDASESLAVANKRIANILKSAEASGDRDIDETLFDAREEKALFEAMQRVLPRHQAELETRNYTAVLEGLASLREPVDEFFDQVMVMTDDQARRCNRLAQLSQLRELFLDVADISCIPAA